MSFFAPIKVLDFGLEHLHDCEYLVAYVPVSPPKLLVRFTQGRFGDHGVPFSQSDDQLIARVVTAYYGAIFDGAPVFFNLAWKMMPACGRTHSITNQEGLLTRTSCLVTMPWTLLRHNKATPIEMEPLIEAYSIKIYFENEMAFYNYRVYWERNWSSSIAKL